MNVALGLVVLATAIVVATIIYITDDLRPAFPLAVVAAGVLVLVLSWYLPGLTEGMWHTDTVNPAPPAVEVDQ